MLRCSCHSTWILVWFLSFWDYLAEASTTVSPTPTEDASDDGFDKNLIYLIIVAAGVFLIAVIIVLVVSFWQKKHSRRQTRQPSEITSHHNPQPVEPAAHIDLSYAPPSSQKKAGRKWWEIPVKDLKIFPDKILGSGQFGIVLLGEVSENHDDIKCAIKTVKENASEGEKSMLKKELEHMSGMDAHPNIVNLIGAQTLYDNLFVVVEYCANGSLHDFLVKRRTVSQLHGESEYETTIPYSTRLRIAFDIANGMDYLATKEFVHRDLAARNVLLDGELRAKVSDFGRTRDINKMFLSGFESMRVKHEPIPTRWMPVETLLHRVFTSKSDVWSYGVVLWEIESGGVRPYDSEHTYHQVLQRVVIQGYRLPQPRVCPDVMYHIMKECWNDDPAHRPTFREIAEIIGNLLKGIIASQPTSPAKQNAPVSQFL